MCVCVCVRVRACVRARACARACVCVCVCEGTPHVFHEYAIKHVPTCAWYDHHKLLKDLDLGHTPEGITCEEEVLKVLAFVSHR